MKTKCIWIIKRVDRNQRNDIAMVVGCTNSVAVTGIPSISGKLKCISCNKPVKIKGRV